MQLANKTRRPDGRFDVALCGISEHAIENLIPAIIQVPELVIRTAITRNRGKQTKLSKLLPGCDFVEHLGHLPASTDLVVAAGPPDYNLKAYQTAQAVRAAAFVEKPLIPNTVLDESGGFVQVGYNLAFAKPISRLLMLDKTLGGIIYLRIKYNTNKPRGEVWDQKGVARSFLYAIGCHPIHLAASVFGFSELIGTSLATTGDDVFLDATMRDASGSICVLSGHNRASSLELDVEAHFRDGSRITLTNLRKWRTSSLTQPKDELTCRKAETISSLSTFNLSEDITGFVEQFRDLALRLSNEEPVNPVVSLKSATLTNNLIEKVLKMSVVS